MLMDIIKERHSIRKYTDGQIRRDDLEKILEALTVHTWQAVLYQRNSQAQLTIRP